VIRRRRERGQSLVEFSMIITVVLLLLLGMMEFGFVFDHHLTLEYATREGARVGSALGNGGGTVGCSAGQSPNAATVDQQIVAALQRVITSPGSAVVPSRIAEIKIYKSGTNGEVTGTSFNTWVYSATMVAGVPVGNGPSVDGRNLFFVPSGATGWNACLRDNNSAGPDSIGVSLTYNYQLVTPLSAAVGFFGPGNGPTTIPIGDRTVMALNPGK
jgi:Flp pilus assembly protein TadG